MRRLVLAATRALLATLVQSNLSGRSPARDVPTLAELAERTASGNLDQAGAERAELVLAYARAFHALCTILAMLTLASAVLVWVALGRTPRRGAKPTSTTTGCEPRRARPSPE